MSILVGAPIREPRCASSGVSLIELMVAMTISIILLAGAVVVFSKARDTFSTMDTTARLQETARYAMSVIENDVRMSGYLGLMSRPELITNLADPLTDPDGAAVALAGCDTNWASDLANYVTGWDQTEGAFGLNSSCAPYKTSWRDTTDGLIVRRASAERIPQSSADLAPFKGRVLIVTSRSAGQIFVGDEAGQIPSSYAQSDPVDAPPLADTRPLLVNAYYVSDASSEGDNYPSLRRKRLVAGPAVQDEEIVPGVEDLQVQYGVDTNGDRNADRYVNADGLAGNDVVVAVRIWIRVRARERDVAWNDTATYSYANQADSAPADERQYRRVVISKTLQLRNARAI
jgi:type IV pilus assembly protein PilW